MFDWGLVDEAPPDARILLAGGLDPDNVATAIDRVQPVGRRRVERRRAGAGPQGPGEAEGVHRGGPGRRARCPYRGPDELPYDWADE